MNQGRERILRELAEMGAPEGVFREESAESAQVDVFYAAWVADILEQAVQSLLEEYHRAGKGDYFRVLYSRICEEMTMPEIADSLSISLTAVENYFKAAPNSWPISWRSWSRLTRLATARVPIASRNGTPNGNAWGNT